MSQLPVETVENKCGFHQAEKAADKKRDCNGQFGHSTCPHPFCKVRVTSYAGLAPYRTSVNICATRTDRSAKDLRRLNLGLDRPYQT